MTSSVDPAKHELPAPATSTPLPHAAPAAQTPPPVGHDNSPVMDGTLGTDPKIFVDANRIHVKHGSLFVDPYLVIHPRELDPANEEALRQKLRLTYSINNPSFFEAPDRANIALNLGQLVKPSLTTARSALLDKIKKFNEQVDKGADTELTKQAQDKRHPFAAVVRDAVENPQADPVGLELLKNGLGMYMLIREKLTKVGFKEGLTNYVTREQTPDQILSDLQSKIGVSPQQVQEAALKDGLDGVGQLLGLEPTYVTDVKKLTEYAQTQDFGYNLVEHWHLGRQLKGIETPLPQKLEVGIEARITAKIDEYRRLKQGQVDVPEPIKAEQTRIADALKLVEPVQRALMYRLGYEICFSPEMTADDIAYYKGIYGLHRKAANDLSDVRGTYRIYFSGHGDLKKSYRTLCHEIAHNLWPNQFTKAETETIDSLVNADAERFAKWHTVMGDPAHFAKFEKLFNSYKAADNEPAKAAVMAETNEWLAHHGVTVDGLFPYLGAARDFQFLVAEANDRLNVEGKLYKTHGYSTPQEAIREVISRFAELKQVELASNPQLLHFLAPGLDQVWEAHYIPHLNRVYHAIGTQPPEQVKLNPVVATPPPAVSATPVVQPTPETAPAAAPSDLKLPLPDVPATPAEATPKVEEHPTPDAPKSPTQTVNAVAAPTTLAAPPATTHAMSADDMPDNSVMKSSIAMNDRVMAAQSALSSMQGH